MKNQKLFVTVYYDANPVHLRARLVLGPGAAIDLVGREAKAAVKGWFLHGDYRSAQDLPPWQSAGRPKTEQGCGRKT